MSEAGDEQQQQEATRRNRGGRPRSPSPRLKQVMVRLTDEEWARLAELAGGRNLAEYLRAAGLHRRPLLPRTVPELNQLAWRELAPVLSNLNQLAHHANSGSQVSDDLAPLLADIRERLMALRAALLGRVEADDP